MTKRNEAPTVARHVLLFESDWTFLEANFGRHTEARLGAGNAVRAIVHKHVEAIRAAQIAAVDELPDSSRVNYDLLAKRLGGQGK